MTKDIAVHDTVFRDLRNSGLNDREIIELTLTIAAYNGVSRFLVALDVGERNSKPTVIEATDPSNSSSS